MNTDELFKLLDNVTQEVKDEPTSNKHSRVVLVDGLNLFLRNFAVLNYINSDGVHIGGLGGFLRSLGFLINNIQPTSVYLVFDGIGSSNNRKNLLPEYKSGRHQTRVTNWDTFDDLEDENISKYNQISRLIHYLKCLPVKTVAIDKAEADDLIAHLSTHLASTHDSKVYIVSSDKDFLQLVNKNIIVYSPIEKDFYDSKTVKSKFGTPPENFILYKTLLGDNSDKVPGVKGLGKGKIFKLFPELQTEILTLDDIFKISAEKYKEHIIYSRIVFEEESIRNCFKIMNLAKPIIDDNEKQFLEELIIESSPELRAGDFLKLYHEDGMGFTIKNVEHWLPNNFNILNSYK
jgi:DNA polymerase-1